MVSNPNCLDCKTGCNISNRHRHTYKDSFEIIDTICLICNKSMSEVGPHIHPVSELKETVNHPSHYGGGENVHEHVKCMLGVGGDKDAFLYNCTKYIWRVLIGGKGTDPIRDLKAAAWYLNKKIEQFEAGNLSDSEVNDRLLSVRRSEDRLCRACAAVHKDSEPCVSIDDGLPPYGGPGPLPG